MLQPGRISAETLRELDHVAYKIFKLPSALSTIFRERGSGGDGVDTSEENV